MQDASRNDSGYVNFISLFKQADLEQAMLPYRNGNSYQAVMRYYFACIGSLDSHELIEPLALLKQALSQLVETRSVGRTGIETPDGATGLSQIFNRVETFEARLQNSITYTKVAAVPVPKNLHFVWLGGGIGTIQRDYVNLWRQVLRGKGYKINLWYDSDSLLAWQTNKLIVEAAKADAMLQGGNASTSESELSGLYEERAIALKQQMFMHINAAVAQGLSADDARVDLLTRAYGQDAAKLDSLIEQNRRGLLELAGEDLQLRDLHDVSEPMTLQAIYDREMRLRGNLAAASDVVRVEVLYREGGSYADVDNLPPLMKTLGGVDISAFAGDARIGVLQLLLDHNPHWMPGRQALRLQYTNYSEQIPQEHQIALEDFAKSQPSLEQVFQAPADRLVKLPALRAVAEQSSLSNAFLMAHAGSAMLKTVIERFRFNYQLIDDTSRLAAQHGVALSDFDAMTPLSREALEKNIGPFHELSMEQDVAASYLAGAAAGYFADGIRPQSEWTIYLTGPGAMRDGLADYERQHFTPADAESLRKEVTIAPLWTVNRQTEEELDHSWKDNETDQQQWVTNEQKNWREGRYATRYKADIASLLTQSTVLFEEGWPVIEGRTVLLTGILQGMIDRLGEPFVNAMKQGYNGLLTFPDGVELGFDDRHAIRAQPIALKTPASLDGGPVQGLMLDELLSRIAEDSLSFFQTSALQRVLLGQLLGARTLDNQSFADLAPELDNLANSVSELGASGRYAAIERHLFKRRAPAFLAGLASHIDGHASSADSALALKRVALGQAHTLFQWGRQVAHIEEVAILEHREQVIGRVGQVLDQFEASSVKLVPQDLLLQGLGDATGGRCYPLALIMSAALKSGLQASRRLRERFFLATIDPELDDSRVFLDALEELRSVQLQDIGIPQGRFDLAEISATLEAGDSTHTLMLNSDNHAMLVAKTVDSHRAIYHFYDPNFGVFEFEELAMFHRALTYFFLQQGMARHYAAYGDDANPAFDLIELPGEKVSDLNLSSGFKVERLLASDMLLPGKAERPLRQRLNSARGQSLISNPQLGSCLRDLDGHWWAQQMADATKELQASHASVSPLVPLFDTLEITPAGSYRINLIDPLNVEHVVQVTSADHRLLRIRSYLSELFTTLSGRGRAAEAGAVHTLNTGFTIQALMNALRGHENNDRTLTTAVRLHAYVNYAQLVHGNVVDVAGLISLVRIGLAEQKVIARTCAPVVGEALGHVANEGVGAVLGLANVGFDVYQLATADDELERVQFGTQLAFDSASLALTAGGLGAAAAGAATAAAVLGGAGVILGGLAVGVAALAQGFARIAEEAKAVGLFFDDLEHAYRGVGYHYDKELGGWVVHPSLIVQNLDFRGALLTLDSPKLFRLRDHFGVPDYNPDYQQALDMRRELGLPGYIKFNPPAGQLIVLPCTPQTCYAYEYKALPFATLRHDTGFDTARRLEKKDRDGQWKFLFSFYSFPSHYIVHRLAPVYRPTQVVVQLDAIDRLLAVPNVPTVWQDKMSYRIEGAGAMCTLLLNQGIKVELLSPSQQRCRWKLVATWAGEQDVQVDVGGAVSIGNIEISFSGRGQHDLVIQLADRQLFSVNRGKRELDILEQTARPGENEQSLLKHYKSLVQQHRLVLPYTPVHHFLIPFEAHDQPRYTTAWYDAAEDRFLYIRNEEVLQADELLLAVVVDGYAYYYEAENFLILQVDAVSGLLKNRYRLLLTKKARCTVRQIEVNADGVIHIQQEQIGDDKRITQFNYLISEGRLVLSSVTHGMDRDLGKAVFAHQTLADWRVVLGDYMDLLPVSERDGVTTIDWQPASFLSVCWLFDPDKRDMVWVRSIDRLCIHPFIATGHFRGWADAIKHLNDLMLLPADDQNDRFFIYDRRAQKLCKVQRIASGESTRWPQQWTHEWVQPVGLVDVVAVEGGYMALTESGLFFNLTAQGEVRLAGLNEHWLSNRARWWQALEAVAVEHSADSIAIVGLRNAADNGYLHAWFVDDRLLLCDSGHDKEVRLLGVTPDQQAAWLFDLSSGEIWSQAFVDKQQFDQLFGKGAQLLQPEALPTPQVEWDEWRFTTVLKDGYGLEGTTTEGVLLKLGYQETEQIVGVNNQWMTAHAEHLAGDLQALIATAEHAAFISLEAAPNLQWYDVMSAKMVRVTGNDLPSDCELLGVRQENVLLSERYGKYVYIFPGMHRVGPFEYIQRNADVLVIEGQGKVGDLLPLLADDVNRLVLRAGQGRVTYHLSRAVWMRLESVIVDCRHGLGEVPAIPGKLILALDAPGKLHLSLVGEHLIIVDPDRQHSLILRDVCSADPSLRGEVFLGFEGRNSYPVSRLVQRLRDSPNAQAGTTLEQLLRAVPA
jgi:insecticidal toxin